MRRLVRVTSVAMSQSSHRDGPRQNERARLRIDEGSAAGRNYAMAFADQAGNYASFSVTEMRLSERLEDLANAALRGLLDRGVAVDETRVQQCRKSLPHSGLANPHEPDEHKRAVEAARERCDALGRDFSREGHCRLG